MPRTAKTTTSPKFRTPNDMSDLDPFLDNDESVTVPIPVPGTDSQDIHSVEPSDLQNVVFTIDDIAEEPQPNDQYHYFKWRLFVTDKRGTKYTFTLNPAKKRNITMNRLANELPVKNMTLVQKQFTEQRNFKLVTYYELTNYTPHSGTISH